MERIYLVTGSNSGIGLETVIGLARESLQNTVVMAARDSEKSRQALERARFESGNQNIHLLTVDLSSGESTRELAREFCFRFDRLDVLIHNAGIAPLHRQVGSEGVEVQFAVHVMAPYLLTTLLLPLLEVSAPSRVVVVSSTSHRWCAKIPFWGLDFKNLEGERGYGRFMQYCRTKLASILLTSYFSRRFKDSGVSFNSLDPGTVETPLLVDAFPKFLRGLVRSICITPKEGAKTSIYLATSEDVACVSGAYFENKTQAQPSHQACDMKLARKLWYYCANRVLSEVKEVV